MPDTSNSTESNTELSAYRDGIGKLRELFTELPSLIEDAKANVEKLRHGLEQFAVVIGSVEKAAKDLPEETRRAMEALTEKGWYIPSAISLENLIEVAREFSQGCDEQAEATLIQYFDCNIDLECKMLCETHPERADIIRAAIAAYKRREYELCIPVLLIQADGICESKTGIGFYAKERGTGNRQLKPHVDHTVVDTLDRIIAEPLRVVPPMIYSDKQRAASPVELNRHAILHGQSTTYATKLNAAKALSQLSYVTWILDRIGSPHAT